MGRNAAKEGVKRLLSQKVSPAEVAEMLSTAKPALIRRLLEIAIHGRDADSLAAIRLAFEYMIGKPQQQTTNVNVTVSTAASQLEALRNYASMVQNVPTIDVKPLEKLSIPAQSAKELVKHDTLDGLVKAVSAHVSPDDSAAEAPPPPPAAGGEL